MTRDKSQCHKLRRVLGTCGHAAGPNGCSKPVDLDAVRRALDEGASLCAIAASFGVTCNTIRNKLADQDALRAKWAKQRADRRRRRQKLRK